MPTSGRNVLCLKTQLPITVTDGCWRHLLLLFKSNRCLKWEKEEVGQKEETRVVGATDRPLFDHQDH